MLLAQAYVSDQVSEPVPNNQWILEFQNLFSIRLIHTSLRSLSYVTGPQNSIYNKYIAKAPSADQWMCGNQIIQSTDHASFSVLGLCIILICGALIIFIDLTLESLLDCVYSSRGKAEEDWKLSSLLQMQRFAFEGQHKGIWTSATAPVPITIVNDRFTPFTIPLETQPDVLSILSHPSTLCENSISNERWNVRDEEDVNQDNLEKTEKSDGVASLDKKEPQSTRIQQ
jgi:hypothetical protein